MTQWCEEAWSQIDPDSVVRGFKKLGIITALDGSEGHLVNIPKLGNMRCPEITCRMNSLSKENQTLALN